MSNDPRQLRHIRAVNQAGGLKVASVMLSRETETLYLRRLARTPGVRLGPTRSFETDRLSKVNQLLTNISLEMGNTDFEFRSPLSGEAIAPQQISSGGSEVVALAAEIPCFFDTIGPTKFNVLLLDKLDAYLHPDLQTRLGKLIISTLDESENHVDSIAVCISTHSSPLVCSFAASPYVSIDTKSFAIDIVELEPASAEPRKVVPPLGYPLSPSPSDDAALILRGEDDEHIWQQAAKTSQGRIKVFPVLVASTDQQGTLETFCVQLLGILYDNPAAFSIRGGGDVVDQPPEHRPPLKRYRLQRYAIEDALLTDSYLVAMDTTREDFIVTSRKQIKNNLDHCDTALIEELAGSSDHLRHKKIRKIRNLICDVADCKRPWEIVVGQAIAALTREDLTNPNMLIDFPGAEMVSNITFRDAVNP